MKKHLLACIFICTAVLAMAQNPVPNSSFENWTNGKPVSWTYSNHVMQTSPGHSGQYAVKGDSVSTLQCFDSQGGPGFPVTQTYGYLNFYYQFHKVADEYIVVEAYILDSTNNYLNCVLTQLIQTGTDTFQPISIPFHVSNPTIVPASCSILFYLGIPSGFMPPITSYFEIDDVSTSNNSLTSITEANAGALDFTISPNPAGNSINISTGELHDAEVTVYNMLGEVQLRSKWNGTGRQLDISRFEQGLYIVTIKQDGVFANRKFQKY